MQQQYQQPGQKTVQERDAEEFLRRCLQRWGQVLSPEEFERTVQKIVAALPSQQQQR
jgi:hypothetical protein